MTVKSSTDSAAWWMRLRWIVPWRGGRAELPEPEEVARILESLRTQHGASLAELSQTNPVMVVFLRHAGCTFCREALADIAAARNAIEADGTRIVLVHMSRGPNQARLFQRYGLEQVDRISDPERLLYRAFGLRRGTLRQLFGWRVWLRGFEAGVLQRHGVGMPQGDGFQMPGVFLLADGELHHGFRHRTAADRPDYRAIARR